MGTLNFDGGGKRCDYCGTTQDRLVVETPTEEIVVNNANLEALVGQLCGTGSDVRDHLIHTALRALAEEVWESAVPEAEVVPADVQAFSRRLRALAEVVRVGRSGDWKAIREAMEVAS